jgi:hypothetical protein
MVELSRLEENPELVRCLVRLRSEGKSLDEIAMGLQAETGHRLATAAVEALMSRVAGPVPAQEGADPKFFSGYLGGG